MRRLCSMQTQVSIRLHGMPRGFGILQQPVFNSRVLPISRINVLIQRQSLLFRQPVPGI